MKIKKGFVKCKATDHWVVVSTGELSKTFSAMIQLNDTASEIWDGIEKGLSAEEITSLFVSEYGISEEKARESVDRIIVQMTESGILE